MITATCKNAECPQLDIDETLLGSHEFVECGVCHNSCEISDERPDPEVTE